MNRIHLAKQRLEQQYSGYVWRKQPLDPKSTKRIQDASVLPFVPSEVATGFLIEQSLVKSYLLKREKEFPELKQYYKPFETPSSHIKCRCTTNLFDMDHPENSICVMTVDLSKERDLKIWQVLGGDYLNRDESLTELVIKGDRFPYYRQNMRWCMDKYAALKRTIKAMPEEEKRLLETWEVDYSSRYYKRQKAKQDRTYPESWLVE